MKKQYISPNTELLSLTVRRSVLISGSLQSEPVENENDIW